MNKTVPNGKNWPPEKPRGKRGGLRAIDAGTSYDVPGKMRRMVHKIEDGEFGRVTDVVCAVRCIKDGKITIRTMYTGKNSMGELLQMAEYLKKDMMG